MNVYKYVPAVFVEVFSFFTAIQRKPQRSFMEPSWKPFMERSKMQIADGKYGVCEYFCVSLHLVCALVVQWIEHRSPKAVI